MILPRLDCLLGKKGEKRTIVGVENSDLAVRADLHPVAHVEGCLPVDGMQHQEGQCKIIDIVSLLGESHVELEVLMHLT